MARFMAAIEGKGGEATRLGSEGSGIHAQAQGWDLGVKVYGHVNGEDEDVFVIYTTSGSNGGTEELIGTVQLVSGRPTFSAVEPETPRSIPSIIAQEGVTS
jgi:hypothetical protein